MFKKIAKKIYLYFILSAFIFQSQLNFAQQFTLNGNATSLSCDCYRLTTANNNQFGSVWNNNLFNLTNSFDFSFDVFLGCNDGGADGLAFVLQPVSTSLGAAGGGLGYAGISPSLDIEIDTYQNASDPSSDHIAIMQNGNTNHSGGNNLAGPVQASAASGNVEDCAYHTIRIVWDAVSNNIDVYFDGVIRTTYTGDIVNNIFGGNPNVYWGFTAATGGANNEHRFCLNIVPNFVTSAPNVCVGNPMQFTDASTSNLGAILQWAWNFGDGTPVSNVQNPIHTYSTAGNYNVTLTINDISGCGASQTFPVTVLASPMVTAPLDANVCPGTQVQMSVSPVDPTMTYTWSPMAGLSGANTATATLTSATATTTYTITATDANGCQGSDDYLLTVYPTPVAAFTTADHCFGTQATFTDNSSVTGGTIVDWVYQFGDGFGANVQNTPYIYQSAGTYNATLQVTDNRGCFATSAATTITVWGAPSPSFTFTSACFGTPNTFTSTSNPAAGAPITITGWDFGDGTQVLGSPISHTYAAPGMYDVTLGIQDQRGCQNGIQQQVSVFELPLADFTVSNICLGLQTCPTELSTVGGSEAISTYDWDWGDGSPHDNAQNPCHTYSASGNYSISLTVTTANGCSDNTTIPITIYENPSANFTYTNVCDGQQMDFTNTSISNDGLITENDWNYGDGNLETNILNGANTYASDGQYTVTLDIQTEYGCTASTSQDITIFQSPTVDFNYSNDCENVPINFTDNSVVAAPTTITSWDWDFGDNSAHGTTANSTHTYSSDGNYDVVLTVSTSDGCSASATNPLIAYPEPIAAFSVPSVCNGELSSFIDASSITSTSISNWDWDFGGGNTSVLQNPTYTIPTVTGQTSYPVTLTVTSNFGCISSVSNNAIVIELPIANFTVSPIPACEGSQVTFNDASTPPPGGTITGWDYNTNNHQGTPIPSIHLYTPTSTFTYSTSFIYNASLTVTSDQGCTNTTVIPLDIKPIPYADFTFDYVCEGNSTSFFDFSNIIIGNITSYSWDFGDASTPALITNPTHQYAASGDYIVTLSIVSDAQCTSTATDTITVNPNPKPSFSASSVCGGVPTLFTNTSTIASGEITNYSWDFGDNTPLDSNQNPTSHLYSGANTYMVSLTEISDSLCTVTYSNTYTVHPNPTASFVYSYSIPDSCLPVNVRFTSNAFVATTDTIISNSYNYGDGISDDLGFHTYEDSGTYDVSQTVTTNFGCTNTILQQQIIWVYPVPTASFSQSTSEIDLFDPNVDFTNHSQGESIYDWDFGDFSDHGFTENPTHTYSDTGCFKNILTVSNQFGCFDTASHSVCVKPFYSLYIPNAFTVNEDTKNMFFTAVGEGIKEYEMRIFNRWGEEVFRSKSIENGWDGVVQSSNTDAPQAVYSYWVRSIDFYDKRHLYRGFVTLIR